MKACILNIILAILAATSWRCHTQAMQKTAPVASAQKGGTAIQFSKKQPASEQIALEWLEPKPGSEAIRVYQKINIAVRASSATPLTRDNFTVLLNEVAYTWGAKSGEVPLVRPTTAKDNSFEYRATLELPKEGRRHSIRVEIRTGNAIKKIEPIIVEKTDQAPRATIVWQSPDPFAGSPFICEQTELEVKASIDVQDNALSPQDVELFLNGRLIPGGLLISDRKPYKFLQKIELSNSAEVQTLMLRVFGEIESDIMPVAYRQLRKPNLYLLSIGPQTNLKFAAKDARDFAALFASQKANSAESLYETIDIQTLTGKEAQTQTIRTAVEGLKTRMSTQEISPHDVVLLFISTHGLIENNDLRLQAEDYNAGRVRSTSISFKTDILDILGDMNCKILLFIDACHGPIMDGSKASPDEIARAIQTLNEGKNGIAVFSSSQLEEYSYEDSTWQNGAFTAAIIKALQQGKADGQGPGGKKDGIITLNELAAYVPPEVKQMVRQVKNKSQTPWLKSPLGDIPIYLVKPQNASLNHSNH